MDVTARQWKDLRFLDPQKILIGLRHVERSIDLAGLPAEIASFRHREYRGFLEGRQAALFLYGLGHALAIDVEFAQCEAADYDVVARYRHGDDLFYVPVQLKELVPEHINPFADLQKELNKLEKYVNSPNLEVAFHLNATQHIEFASLRLPKVQLGGIWFFGATSPSQDEWLLVQAPKGGDWRFYQFQYPETLEPL